MFLMNYDVIDVRDVRAIDVRCPQEYSYKLKVHSISFVGLLNMLHMSQYLPACIKHIEYRLRYNSLVV